MAPNKRRRTSIKATSLTEPTTFSDDEDSIIQPPKKLAGHTTALHSTKNVAPLTEALLKWYDSVKNSRGMPWRKDYDASLTGPERAQKAYEVLVSEIMLQQTQIATVIPYYNRWLTTFPTISDLTKADIETVNGVWKGLGYYRRAALLLKGAKKVEEDFGGVVPGDIAILQKQVPGVGRYTAGAVCSIVYNVRAPAVDGNVQRLLSRVLALHAPPKAKPTLDIIWNAATQLVKGTDHPGAFNQALIELGSTVCKVHNPSCDACPLSSGCAAFQQTKKSKGNLPAEEDIEELCTICEPFPDSSTSVTRYPMKAERKKARDEDSAVCVVEWKDKEQRWFLLVRRPEKGLLAGLWEFPTLDFNSPPTPEALRAAPESLLSELLVNPPSEANKSKSKGPLDIVKTEQTGSLRHIFSHIHKTYHSMWLLLEGGGSPPKLAHDEIPQKKKKRKMDVEEDEESSSLRLRWTKESDIDSANLSTGGVKVWKQVNEHWGGGVKVPKSNRRKRQVISSDEEMDEDDL